MNATAQRLSVESSWLRILIFISYHHRTYYSFQSKEREIGSKQGSDTSWWGKFHAAPRFLEALQKHPLASNPTFLTSRCWSYSSIGSLHFHKYFSNLLRCLGGTVVATPMPLSLHQVLRKGVPLRASTLISFDACRWLAKRIPVVMKPFTVKWSSGTWLISATY